MATQFPVSYSAQAAMYANGTPSQAAGTYYIQSGASDISQVIEGNIQITGDLQVDGNEVVGGSLTAASLVATGAVTGATVAAAGAVTAASVAATNAVTAATMTASGILSGGSIQTPGTLQVAGAGTVSGTLTTFGNLYVNGTAPNNNCAVAGTITGTGGMFVPNGAAYRSTATQGAAPGVSGMQGTRLYQVSVGAGAVNVDVGLNEILNDTVPHQLSVTIIGAGAPGTAPFASYGVIQSYPISTGQVPNLQISATGGGYSWNASGGAGTFNLGLNGAAAATTATVIITIIF
jgi:cytoskeletal protein CcmA (bactofilin family)